MNELKYCNYCESCKGHRIVETQTFNVKDYVVLKMPSYEALHFGDGWATVEDKSGNTYDVFFISEKDTVKVGIVSIEGDV